MANESKVERFFTIPVHELYGYFIDPRLIEKWSAPDGMSLHVTEFDARVGGHYRYEHFSEEGKYICTGHIRKIIQNEFLHMVDDQIIDPKGKEIAKGLQCEIRFTSLGTGSGVSIHQYGFKNKEFAEECRMGWEQCFAKLQDLLKDSGIRQFHPEKENLRSRGTTA